jgi:hypothetical protein
MLSMTELYWVHVREIAVAQQRTKGEERAELERAIAPFRPPPDDEQRAA